MQGLFHNCPKLVDARGLTNWNVSKVISMSHMLNVSNDCISGQIYGELVYLDMSNWNMAKVSQFNWFIDSQYYVQTEMTIINPNIIGYDGMFKGAATKNDAHIIVNYTAETSEKVDQLIATKSSDSHVTKGRLVETP